MIDNPSELHLSTQQVVAALHENYPNVPLIALGQTIFWDEPAKAVLRRILDLLEPERKMILGVHDTDYFAKAPARVKSDSKFAIVPHNDDSTRELWAAVGEIERLFGCEVIPDRETLYKYGVLVDKIAKFQDRDLDDLVNEVTEAWGWRGLVRIGTRDVLAMDVQVDEVTPALLEMVEWGFSGTKASLKQPDADFSGKIREWILEFKEHHPDASLSLLYKDLLPRFYAYLLGETPRNIEVSCSGEIFKFNPETADRPRFHFVDLFLNPKTRQICATAYNEALIGTETYTLDRFGHGAIPFDLVVPGKGRGTVRVMPDRVSIDLPHPEHISTDIPVESVQQLAQVVSSHFGSDVSLVGKAVALINMINSEFMLVFHTFGSSYVVRTQAMNRQIIEAGIPLKINPILRLGHRTWDALESNPVVLNLPQHLAKAFGKKEITGDELSKRWVSVARDQGKLLETLEKITSTRESIPFLQQVAPNDWGELFRQYEAARHRLAEIGQHSEEIKTRIDEYYKQINELKDLVERLEASKGLYYREHVRPLQEQLWTLSEKGTTEGPEVETIQSSLTKQEAVRSDMGREISQHRETIHHLQDQIKSLKLKMRELERGEEAIRLRKEIARLDGHAQAARLDLVRDAYLVYKGLPYTNFRPSAWWLPMVDPSGNWFDQMTRRAELYLESLGTDDIT